MDGAKEPKLGLGGGMSAEIYWRTGVSPRLFAEIHGRRHRVSVPPIEITGSVDYMASSCRRRMPWAARASPASAHV